MTNLLRARVSWLALVALLGAACGDDNKPGGTGIDGGTPPGAGKDGSIDGRVPPSGGDGGTVIVTPDGSVIVVPRVTDAGGDGSAPDSGPPVVACDPSAAPVVPALKLEPVPGVSTLTRIVFAAQAPGSSDWYLVQQTGTIRVVSGGQLQPTAFLDVTAQIAPGLASDDERGLLSLAFPPDYATSKKFYVVLTPTKDTTGFPVSSDSVVEYQRGDGNAAPMRLRTIVQLPPSETNHNGGTVTFGTDGFLYYGTGDGGAGCNNNNEAGEPQLVTQDKLHGKILRFDPKKTSAPYAADGNPFAGMAGDDARVFHYGFRNPFRFGFDRATGDLYVGDVGQDTYEEVDYAPAGSSGLNFGWPKFEGAHMDTCGPGKTLRAGTTPTPPIVDIPRAAGAPPPFGDYKSVMGGYVYRGSAIPSLQGVYIFGDYVGKRMGALRQCGATTSPVTPINKNKDANAPKEAFFAQSAGAAVFDSLTGIVQDNDAELYFVANGNSLLKLVPGP